MHDPEHHFSWFFTFACISPISTTSMMKHHFEMTFRRRCLEFYLCPYKNIVRISHSSYSSVFFFFWVKNDWNQLRCLSIGKSVFFFKVQTKKGKRGTPRQRRKKENTLRFTVFCVHLTPRKDTALSGSLVLRTKSSSFLKCICGAASPLAKFLLPRFLPKSICSFSFFRFFYAIFSMKISSRGGFSLEGKLSSVYFSFLIAFFLPTVFRDLFR